MPVNQLNSIVTDRHRMMERSCVCVKFGTLIILIWQMCCSSAADKSKPNIVLLVADDLGYGDLGCFGNDTINTPNIDRMVSQGAKLTHHLAASSICSPSRAALMTGRYPIRSGMAPTPNMRVNLFVANKCGLPENETTIAEIAKSRDYKTALIGKWHLGLSKEKFGDNVYHPLNQGFDYYYGHILTNIKDFSEEGDRVILSQRPYFNYQCAVILLITIFSESYLYKKKFIGKLLFILIFIIVFIPVAYFFFVFHNLLLINSILMRNFDVVEMPIHLESLMQRYVKESIEYMEQRTNDKSPFLLVISFSHTHTALRVAPQFKGVSKHGRYGDAVAELDWGIGELMSSMDQLGLSDNTLVYFTSDNGAHLEETGVHGERDGGSNGILKGGKAHGAVDGGIRMPSSVRFPGKIKSNSVLEEPTWQMDMLPTIAGLIGAETPKDRIIDGRNIFPLLQGKETITPHEFFFHYCDIVHAVRYRPRTGKKIWKLVFYMPNYLPGKDRCHFGCLCRDSIKLEKPLLYELTSDPGERNALDVDSSDEYRQLVSLMKKALDEHVNTVIPVEQKLSLYNVAWRPHLQPCCNFPYCKCVDEKFNKNGSL